MWTKEDCRTLKEYFDKVGSQLWPFNNIESEDDGLGGALFETAEQFESAMSMLDEDG